LAAPISVAEDSEQLRLPTDRLSEKAGDLRRANERLTALVDLGLELGSERDPQRLLQMFCHAARKIIGARYAIAAILDGDGRPLLYFFTSGMDAETATRLGAPNPERGGPRTVLRESRCLRLHNPGGNPVSLDFPSSYPPFRSWLGAPIVSPGRVYGWLSLLDKIGAEVFSDEDERLAGILATQVGQVYEKGSLYAELVQHSAELQQEVGERKRAEQDLAERVRLASLVGDVGVALTQGNSLKDTLDSCVRALVRNLDAAFARIWIVNEAQEVLELQASAGLYTHTDGPHGRVPVGKFKIGLIAKERKPHLTNDVLNDPRVSDQEWAKREGMVAFAGYPLLVGDRLVGVMALFARQPLGPATLQAMAAVVVQIALSIEHKRAEHAVRNSEARKAAILNASLDAIITMDHEGLIRGWNLAAERIFGYPESTALGRPLAELIIPTAVRQRLYQGLAHYLSTGHGPVLENRLEMLAVRADGNEFPAELTVTRIPVEGPAMFTGYLRDITARKQLEDQFHQSQARLQHVVASSPAVLFTLSVIDDQTPGIAWTSDNLSEMLGYSPAAALGQNWWLGNVHPEDRDQVVAQFQHDLLNHSRSTYEYRFRHGDGSYRWTRCELRVIRDAAGRPGEVVGSWTDITERRHLEDQYRQAQKMDAFGQLAGGVAHDFNNLLTIINGYADILLDSLPPDDPNRALLSEIHKAGERSAGLTRQLLAFSRQQILAPRVLDLNVVVADTASMLRRVIGEDVRLSTTTAQGLWPVKADPGQIEQILLNLAVNARDAMPTGGKLTLETRNVQLDKDYAAQHPDVRPGPHVLLAVSDTGCGMTPVVRAKIFEPFFTTKEVGKGTGLGLATVYGIVKQSGGHVSVYSETGLGTTFKVYLPRTEPVGGRVSGLSRVMVPIRGTETVLVVEDEAAVRALTRFILQQAGYTVLEAADGDDALRVATGYAGHIDLVVTDVVMPGMGGRKMAEAVRARHGGVRVLFVSGYTDDAVVRHGILHEGVSFLQKPFTPTSLTQKVREVLDAPVDAGAG
jgi:PAS domain S-box-containing protein